MPSFRAILTTEDNHGLSARVHDFRRALFIDHLRWDLRCDAAGGERDEFDTDGAIHMALLEAGRLVGSFRALRADEPYLCRSVFPQLAEHHPYPVSADAWEISRFGVVPGAGRSVALITYALMFEFARRRRARALIALADLTYERFLASLGIVTVRYGPPGLVGHDREGRPLMAVAGEIPMAAQAGRRFDHLMQHLDHVEIVDETSVLGRGGVPSGPPRTAPRAWERPREIGARAVAARA